jgi:hypothetical protein
MRSRPRVRRSAGPAHAWQSAGSGREISGHSARRSGVRPKGLKRGLDGRLRTVLLRLAETIPTETPPLDSCSGPLGPPGRGPITGHRAQRILPGAIHVGPGEVAAMITQAWTPEEHQDFRSVIRASWRGWNLVHFEDRASQPTAPDSLAGAESLGIEVRWWPRATPELKARDPLWRPTQRETRGSRARLSVEASALAACQSIMGLSPRDRLRQAGILSGNFWLTK